MGHVTNPAAKFEDPMTSFMSYELYWFPLISIENVHAATAYAPNHVTWE